MPTSYLATVAKLQLDPCSLGIQQMANFSAFRGRCQSCLIIKFVISLWFKVQTDWFFHCELMSEKHCGGVRLSHSLLMKSLIFTHFHLPSAVNSRNCQGVRSCNSVYFVMLYECVLCFGCMIWYEWFMSSCCWCVNNQRLEHLSSSLSLSLYLFMHSVTHFLSLPSGLSIAHSTWTPWIWVITARITGHVCSCWIFALLHLMFCHFPLHYHFLSRPPVHLFFLAPGLSVCHRSHLKRARKRQSKQQTLIVFATYLVCYLLRWLVGCSLWVHWGELCCCCRWVGENQEELQDQRRRRIHILLSWNRQKQSIMAVK